jgi:N-acetylmuramoyl-L-alanine amidase
MVLLLRYYQILDRYSLLLLLILSGLLADNALAVGNGQAPLRKGAIDAIVIHAIGGPECKHNKVEFTEASGDAKRWKLWFEKQKSVSIHYIVDRDGKVEHSIDENRVAWHANDYNRRSIGIELVNKGDGIEPYPDKQMAALTALVRQILARHKTINKANIVRHSDIDNRTFVCGGKRVDVKQDPGDSFSYQKFLLTL